MEFTPRSKREIEEQMCLSPGTYDFEVVTAKDTTSKSGNQMIALELRVFDGAGTAISMRDWLLSHHPMCLRKLIAFCESAGLMDDYEAGRLYAASCVGASGKVVTENVDDDQYGLQSRVKDYAPPGAKTTPASAPAAATFQPTATEAGLSDDDIPF